MKSLDVLVDDLKTGKTTSAVLVNECFTTIEAKNSELFAFLRTYKDEALKEAQASDDRRKKGKLLSGIDGIPVSIKDNFSYKDHTTSAGSHILENYTAPYDATVIQKLKSAGAIIVGQTNMDEFAMGSSTENSYFGKTKNPFDLARVPGGSSGGAAASVASGMVPLAFGSDTGGSIRQPAAFCGVAGLKPTYGAVSRYGLLAMASSLDQIGPVTTNVASLAMGFDAIKGIDEQDSTSQSGEYIPPKEQYTIGLPKQFLGDGLSPVIRSVLEKSVADLTSAGYKVVEVDIPLLEQSVAIYYLIMPAEVSSNMARYDGIRFGLHGKDVVDSRTQGFGPEVKRRIMLGTYALSAGYADKYYKRAQAVRAALTSQLLAVFESVDCLIGPVTPELPFKFGEKSDNPLAMYLSDIYTIPVNLAGLPGITVPSGTVEFEGKQLPVGLQLIGKPWSEPQLFDLGHKIEKPVMNEI